MMDDEYCQSSTAGNHTTVCIFERLYCLIMLNCELANVQKKNYNSSAVLGFSWEELCIVRPITRSVMIFVVQKIPPINQT